MVSSVLVSWCPVLTYGRDWSTHGRDGLELCLPLTMATTTRAGTDNRCRPLDHRPNRLLRPPPRLAVPPMLPQLSHLDSPGTVLLDVLPTLDVLSVHGTVGTRAPACHRRLSAHVLAWHAWPHLVGTDQPSTVLGDYLVCRSRLHRHHRFRSGIAVCATRACRRQTAPRWVGGVSVGLTVGCLPRQPSALTMYSTISRRFSVRVTIVPIR